MQVFLFHEYDVIEQGSMNYFKIEIKIIRSFLNYDNSGFCVERLGKFDGTPGERED